MEKTKRDAKDDLEYSVLCPAGFESVLADELRGLGCRRVRPLHGCVAFFGELRDGYRVCLWSRLASRVVLVAKRIDCETDDDLYNRCVRLPWEKHIGPHATIAVEVRGGTAQIRDKRYAALKVKDAICDYLRDLRGSRPNVDTDQPDVRIVVSVRERRATIGIDLGGGPLVDHGYRVPARGRAKAGHASFLREDMASLMLVLGAWDQLCADEEAPTGGVDAPQLVDPLGRRRGRPAAGGPPRHEPCARRRGGLRCLRPRPAPDPPALGFHGLGGL